MEFDLARSRLFTSEDEIVESLLAAKAKAPSKPSSLAQRAANFVRRKQDDGSLQEPLARRLAALARPSVWLETRKVEDETDVALGTTKLGGRPDMPANADWPVRPTYPDAPKRIARCREEAEAPDSHWSWATAEDCESFRRDYAQMAEILESPYPLQFICQIDFAEMWRTGPLDPDFPKSGLLSVFYDVLEMPWGFDPPDHAGSAILFHDQGPEALTRLETPEEFAAVERYTPIAPLACTGHACLRPLPIETAAFDGVNLSQSQESTYWDWWWQVTDPEEGDGSDWNRHLVGGWPVPIQGDMQTECALVAAGHYCGDGTAYRAPEIAEVRATAKEWVLLLQIGSDDDAGVMWGDVGNLYVWIRREDLIARRFEAARLILQCS